MVTWGMLFLYKDRDLRYRSISYYLCFPIIGNIGFFIVILLPSWKIWPTSIQRLATAVAVRGRAGSDHPGWARNADQPAPAKAFGHPSRRPKRGGCRPVLLARRTKTRRGTAGWKSASRSEAWCPSRAAARTRIAELGPEKPEGQGMPAPGPPPGRLSGAGDQSGDALTWGRPTAVRAFLSFTSLRLFDHRARQTSTRLGGAGRRNGPAAAGTLTNSGWARRPMALTEGPRSIPALGSKTGPKGLEGSRGSPSLSEAKRPGSWLGAITAIAAGEDQVHRRPRVTMNSWLALPPDGAASASTATALRPQALENAPVSLIHLPIGMAARLPHRHERNRHPSWWIHVHASARNGGEFRRGIWSGR